MIEEFAALTNNQGSIQALRELVLQLAVDGQLTAKLTKGEHWRSVPIDQIAECFIGNSISASEKSDKYEGRDEGRDYVGTKDVDGWHGSITYDTGVRIPLSDDRFRVAPKGSVVICAEGGSAGRKIGLVERDINFGNKLICCNPDETKILHSYLFRVFQSEIFHKSFRQHMTGIIGGISLKKFKNLSIPLPNLATQKAIADTVDHIFALCEDMEVLHQEELALKRATVGSLIDRLLVAQTEEDTGQAFAGIASRFNELFDHTSTIDELQNSILELAYLGALGGDNPKIVRLEDLLAFGPRNGFSPKPSALRTDTKSITLSAVTKGEFDEKKFKYIDDVIESESHLWLRLDDILIQRANSIDHVGASTIYRGAEFEFIYPDLIMKVRVLDDVEPEYVLYCLQSPSIRRYFRDHATGTSGSMPKINQGVVKGAPIPLISRPAQSLTIETVRELSALCELLRSQVWESERLQAELMNALVHAFVGQGPHGGGAANETTEILAQASDVLARKPSSSDQSKALAAIESSHEEKPAERSPSGRLDLDLGVKFTEAVLVGAIVTEFFKVGGEPIGNFRLQKAVYFARRHNGERVEEMKYLRKAAGPYNPSMKYSGGIAIAKQKNWLREAKGRFGFGHMPGPSANEMADWIAQFGFGEAAQWVADRFRFKKNEDWEVLATVDYAIEHLQSLGIEPDATQILQFIEADDEWRPKIEKLRLTETSIEAAMVEVKALFGTGSEERTQ
ncbi:restriction endonuclease subunit S [Erythrobacter sp. KY5]|uniref:restriction endonuclease subunit S n=1 Tax=Erythrobacter sp. KY5 TaxID=2011159 RepID=UPI0013A6E2A9|nr:restriction endonuclease subunit S [Erythrobacter sp. KY5]